LTLRATPQTKLSHGTTLSPPQQLDAASTSPLLYTFLHPHHIVSRPTSHAQTPSMIIIPSGTTFWNITQPQQFFSPPGLIQLPRGFPHKSLFFLRRTATE
jgi:hypothetical protein